MSKLLDLIDKLLDLIGKFFEKFSKLLMTEDGKSATTLGMIFNYSTPFIFFGIIFLFYEYWKIMLGIILTLISLAVYRKYREAN